MHVILLSMVLFFASENEFVFVPFFVTFWIEIFEPAFKNSWLWPNIYFLHEEIFVFVSHFKDNDRFPMLKYKTTIGLHFI